LLKLKNSGLKYSRFLGGITRIELFHSTLIQKLDYSLQLRKLMEKIYEWSIY
jgi:hypothetical protein